MIHDFKLFTNLRHKFVLAKLCFKFTYFVLLIDTILLSIFQLKKYPGLKSITIQFWKMTLNVKKEDTLTISNSFIMFYLFEIDV